MYFDGRALCKEYQKIFQFNPDPNSKKGHVLEVTETSGNNYLSFKIAEFTILSNGTIDKKIFRSGDITDGKMYFAPSTGILVNFTRVGGSDSYYDFTFSATIAETAQNHHCPHPFIELQPYVPVILEDTAILYKCDVQITTPDGYDIRIDHINDAEATHETLIKVYDYEMDEIERLHLCAASIFLQFNCYFNVLRTTWISEILLQKGAREGPYLAQIIYRSQTSCQTTFSLPVHMREKFKIQIAPISLSQGSLIIDHGPNNITTKDSVINRPFAFESPVVTLRYEPNYGERYRIELMLVDRQEGCACPPQPNIAANLYVQIPPHCKNLDCVYLLPDLDDQTLQYRIDKDRRTDYVASRRPLKNYEYKVFYDEGGKWTMEEQGRHIVRIHRDTPTVRTSTFNFTYTSIGVHIDHAERCGCFNKTVLLQANEPMQLSSPDFPSHYCDNLVCVTTYIAPAHQHVEVKLDEISLEPENDRVAFFDGNNITGRHIEVVTGELIISEPISSTENVLTAVFISNGAVAFDGFNGTVTAVMNKSWSDHLKHHISTWWWLLSGIALLTLLGAALIVIKKRGMRRNQSLHLMDL